MQTTPQPPLIFLMGPTAAGKTALACDLYDALPLEIISVDSALVYRGMDIGTAKPDAISLQRYPHHLIDIRDPADPYSAAAFRHDALGLLRDISAAGRVPLLVGGTGLYFRALERGLSPLPAADEEIRASLNQEAARQGWPALHARLQCLDPTTAARISPGDGQRIQRALEVIELGGGVPFSKQLRRPSTPLPYRVLKLALVPADRAHLHRRIEERFAAMLDAGFLDEVKALLARNLAPDLPAWRAVGYRQARAYLEERVDYPHFRNKALAATRQLAKRQITWLRGETDARWFDPLEPATHARLMQTVRSFLR